MGKMMVYHGSYTKIEKPKIIKGRNTKDFGPGFYCTIIREQAERWARRYDTPKVNVYTVRMEESLNILEFKEMTEEWLDFIVACRLGKPHTYDIVEGPMANDTIFNYVQNFIDKKISRAAFWELAKFNHPTHQISFHTLSALDCLTFVKSEVVYDREGKK